MTYDWNRQEPARSPWRSEVVPRISSILIQRAKIGRPITYGELAAELELLHGLEPKDRKTLYGPAVGTVGFAIQQLVSSGARRSRR